MRICRPLGSGVMVVQKSRFILAFLFCWMTSLLWTVWPKLTNAECLPSSGCSAMAIYIISSGDILSDIAKRFQTDTDGGYSTLQTLNNISDAGLLNLQIGEHLLIPFDCECGGDQLGHNFTYAVVAQNGTDNEIAETKYGNLTRVEWIAAATGRDINYIDVGDTLIVPVNCSCGNPGISLTYGLFATYVVQDNDTLSNLSINFNISGDLLQQYNPTVFDKLQPTVSIIFVPVKDSSGKYPPFNSSASATGSGGRGTNKAALIGAVVGGVVAILAVAGIGTWCFCINRPKKHWKASNKYKNQDPLMMDSTDSSGLWNESGAVANASIGRLSSGLANLPTDISIEFSYEELAAATDNFSIAKEIGKGGFATVYYGELHGQRLAIKKMDLKATKEFINEMKVLTRVHHTNLVQLVGYCTSSFLFLVYEYVDNGTLTQHLRASGRNGTPLLPWDTRVQIALDAARALEYIHDHTTPTFIHRDIKSSNILLDINYRAKVGDFGLTKLTNPGGMPMTNSSTLAGTFGYMAPEYAQYGTMSPKADVYSFGVVLFQIISAKEAIINDTQEAQWDNSKRLVPLFQGILNDPNGKENIHMLVDPALGDDYPVESVWKMATLAGRCTRENPDLRPAMREVVVDLMTLLHPTQD